MICRSGGSESRLAKAAGAEPCGQMREGKLHAVVARSTFASEKAKNTSRSHISKSKCTKRLMFGPLLEVETSKKCTPLWRKACVQAKIYKTPHVRTTFGP